MGMGIKLSYRPSGYPGRTPRTRARGMGAKVPEKPQLDGYCTVHGMPHVSGACSYAGADAEAEQISRSGAAQAKSPMTIKPFKLGGK